MRVVPGAAAIIRPTCCTREAKRRRFCAHRAKTSTIHEPQTNNPPPRTLRELTFPRTLQQLPEQIGRRTEYNLWVRLRSRGHNLIFLLSQPRAGSTLLQRILGAHPAIHTVSEPWIALSPLFALRDEGVAATYDSLLARNALKDFLQHLPEGEAAYLDAVRLMLNHLYQRSLAGSGKTFFLDKTPRYYFVIPELRQLFPDARFLFLLRNPLAVLASILETWVKNEDAERLRSHWHDLLVAPQRLLEGIRSFAPDGIVVRYEELVSAPEAVIRSLCERLGVPYLPEMIEYGPATGRPRWLFGDQGTIYGESRPVLGRVERWREVLRTSATWQSWARDYLSKLGPALVGEMGYDYESLGQGLPEAAAPSVWMGHVPDLPAGLGPQRVADILIQQERVQTEISDLQRQAKTFETAAAERLVAMQEKDEALLDITREAEARERGLRELTAVIQARDAHVVELELLATERLTALEKTQEALLDITREAAVLKQQARTFEVAAAERLVALQEQDEALRRLSAELNAGLTVIHELEPQAGQLARIVGELQSRTVQLEFERDEAALKAEAQLNQLRAFEVEGWRDYFRRRYLRRRSRTG